MLLEQDKRIRLNMHTDKKCWLVHLKMKMTCIVTHDYKLDWRDEHLNLFPFDDKDSIDLDKIGDFEFHSSNSWLWTQDFNSIVSNTLKILVTLFCCQLKEQNQWPSNFFGWENALKWY